VARGGNGAGHRSPDYDTMETVTCKATFLYDMERQRSLQHFLTIEDLPEEFHTVVIPSGAQIAEQDKNLGFLSVPF
jgi:hypothetical protein